MAPMRGSPKDSRIFAVETRKLPKVLGTFKTKTMGYEQTFFKLSKNGLGEWQCVFCVG